MANQDGKVTATTMLMPLRRGWSLWCRVLWWAAARVPAITAPLRRQSFIHIARWSLVDELGGEPLGHTCLYFESNFDDSLDAYVDVFLRAVPWRMRMQWAGAVDYPGLHPSSGYRDWSDDHANAVQHYYAAYSNASTTEVAAALAVTGPLDRLEARAPHLGPDAFAAAYRRTLTELNRWL
jgi:hypothetical protein